MTYFLSIKNADRSFLAHIRHWANLKIAIETDLLWVKGFSEAEINSIVVKSIPYKSIYLEKEGQLFPLNSLLPTRNVPSLLWTPIERGLTVKLPPQQENTDILPQKIDIELVPTSQEQAVVALLTPLHRLAQYIETAPAHRLKGLEWVVIEDKLALILGKPLLPLPGKVFWQRQDFLIPAGFDFKWYSLVPSMNQLLNFEQKNVLVWEELGSYFLVEKSKFQELSIGSFRQTNLLVL